MKPMSIYEQEIRSQPEIIARLLETQADWVGDVSTKLRGRFERVLVAARGSSDNAARYAQYLFGVQNQLVVSLAAPSLYTVYDQQLHMERTLVMGISQSGQSPDVVEVVAAGRRQGCPTLAITNDPASPLAQAAEYTIELRAGVEAALPASKTYTTALAVVALFSATLTGQADALTGLHQVPGWMQDSIDKLAGVGDAMGMYGTMTRCVVVGRGLNLATAHETALKVREVTGIIAEPYSAADFRHGPMAVVGKGYPVIMIAPQGAVFEDVSRLCQELRSLEATLSIISDDSGLLTRADLPLPIASGVPELFSPFSSIVAGQLLSLALAQSRGLDPDRPEGIRKITHTF